MIEVIFTFAGEHVLVIVDGNNIQFAHSNQPGVKAPIEGLQLSKKGVLREFPDLEGRDDWREEAIFRFRNQIKSLKTEDEKVNYIISDLKKHGYIPKFKQKKGFRPEVIK